MKIKMNLSQIIEDVYARFMLFKKASGLADKTISTYSQQFRCISNYLDPHIPIDELTSDDLNQMINKMRDKGLSANSIRSYTRMLKVFLTWCNDENITTLNIKKYRYLYRVHDAFIRLSITLSVKISDKSDFRDFCDRYYCIFKKNI